MNIFIRSQQFINVELFKKGLLNNFNIDILDELLDDNTKIIYFISHAFLLLKNNQINKNNFEEIIENRDNIITDYLNNQTNNNVILIKYEELINNFNDVINNLILKFKLECKNNIYNLNDFVDNKLFTYFNHNLITLFNQKINIENEKKINYYDIENFKPDICFFHIEKCMGTSLRLMLYEYYKNIYSENDIFFPDFYNDLNLIQNEDLKKMCSYNNNYKVLLCHCSFNHIGVTESFSKICYSITCVREPIKRFISHYYHFIKNETTKNILEIPIEEFKQILKSNHANLLLIRLSGETLDLKEALNNIKLINCLLITEHIDSDIIYFNNILNKKYNEKLECEYIKKNFLNFFYEDYIIYNTIINMNIEDRIKI